MPWPSCGTEQPSIGTAMVFETRSGAMRTMPHGRKISARDLADDVRSGLTDAQLITKYHLAPGMLEKLLAKLLDLKAIRAEELDRRHSLPEETPRHRAHDTHRALRHIVDFVLPVYETKNPGKLGLVLDLTQSGAGLRGIEARPGDTKSFVIPADDFFEVGRVGFQALCRWAKKEAPGGECLTGFKITFISKTDLGEIRKLIKLIDEIGMIETSEYVEHPSDLQDTIVVGEEEEVFEIVGYDFQPVPGVERRVDTRQRLPFPLPILEATNRTNKGVIVNITEKGIGIMGLEAREGERRTLVIPAYGFEMFDSIVMVAECSWVRRDMIDGKVYSGFKIVQCTSKNAKEIARLVATLMNT